MAARKTSSDARKERLAKALKANLARRKGQAKTRKSAAVAPKTPPDDNGCPN
jgi:ribosomal protein L39E